MNILNAINGHVGTECKFQGNPERIESSSPGLARFPEGQPWVKGDLSFNSERVGASDGTDVQDWASKRLQLLQSWENKKFSPGVARCSLRSEATAHKASQPWAGCCNPFRIEDTPPQPFSGCKQSARRCNPPPTATNSNRLAILSLVILLGLLVAGFPTFAAAKDMEEAQIRITIIKGDSARVSADGQKWKAAKAGQKLKPGMFIQTGHDTTIDLQVEPTRAKEQNNETRNLIKVYEDSKLLLQKLSSEDGTNHAMTAALELQAGKMLDRIGKLVRVAKYQIKFPGGWVEIQPPVEGKAAFFNVDATGNLQVLLGASVIGSEEPGKEFTQEVPEGHLFDMAMRVIKELPLEITRAYPYDLPVESPRVKSEPKSVPQPAQVPVPNRGAGMGGALRVF